MLPFAAGTFFPFTELFRRTPSFAPQRPYGYRTSRSSPNNNLIPIQTPVLGLRVFVPRELLNMFNVRPPGGQEPTYSRPNPFNPFATHPNYPNIHRPNGFPQPFVPNYFPQNYSPNYQPQPQPHPPFDAGTFINLMRALYPNMIYRPDPRYPNVFAIRFPPDQFPDSRQPPPPPPEFDEESNRFFPDEIPPNVNQFLESPPNLPQSQSPQYNQSPQNQQQPQNHLIVIR